MLDLAKDNFNKLESRILAINSDFNNLEDMREMINDLERNKGYTLIMATGGSKVVAYYLQSLLERIGWFGEVCEVIDMA